MLISYNLYCIYRYCC